MSTVIAGKLQLQDQVEEAIAALVRAGFARDRIASFYVNPPGQNATFPLGGDRYASPGAKEVGKGAIKGASVAAAAGAALGAVASPVGAVIGGLVGAQVGSLAGGLSYAKERNEKEETSADGTNPNTAPLRRAGMLVAVAPAKAEDEAEAVEVLHRCGATDMEIAEGEIVDTQWRDFDPLSAPRYL